MTGEKPLAADWLALREGVLRLGGDPSAVDRSRPYFFAGAAAAIGRLKSTANADDFFAALLALDEELTEIAAELDARYRNVLQ